MPFLYRVLVAGALMPAVQSLSYFIAKLLVARRPKRSFLRPIDGKIPFIPQAVLPYCSSFVFWVVGFIVIYLYDPATYALMLAAQTLGSLISFSIFVAMPTQMVQPEPPPGFWGRWVALVYRLDSPPVNLYPSMHCMASWVCVFAALRCAPLGWQIIALVWTLAIAASTVTVKQHYFADTTAGLLVAAASWFVCLRLEALPRLMAAALAALGL